MGFRVVGVAVAVSAIALAIVVVGRLEATREVNSENRAMAVVFQRAAAVGMPDGWRIDDLFRCLIYSTQGDFGTFELCFDPSGALVETADRQGTPRFSTLRSEPSRAAIHVDSRDLDDVLREMNAYAPQPYRGPGVSWSHDPGTVLSLPRGSGLPGAGA